MQTAGDFIGILVELAARMQLGHDDFGGGNAFAFVHVGRDAATVIGDGAGTVGVDDDLDLVAVTGKRFVDGVVYYLVDNHVIAGHDPSSVSPIYIPGRLRTASRPFRTLIESAPYSVSSVDNGTDIF